MEKNTTTYSKCTTAEHFLSLNPERPWATPEKCSDPIYYSGDIGFKITGTHKLAQDNRH